MLGRSIDMQALSRLAMVLVLAGGSSCVPLNPSAHRVIGRWQVECQGGKETLDLRRDGRYVYTIESPRRRLRVDGTWTIQPSRERLESAHIVLRKAPQSCENADLFKNTPDGDNTLEPVWEWGRTLLSYNPDFGGFRRIGSLQ